MCACRVTYVLNTITNKVSNKTKPLNRERERQRHGDTEREAYIDIMYVF